MCGERQLKIREPATKQETAQDIIANNETITVDENSTDNSIDISVLAFVEILDSYINTYKSTVKFDTFCPPLTSMVISKQPQNGTLKFNPNKETALYTPNTGFCGTDYFHYTIILDAGPGEYTPQGGFNSPWVPWEKEGATGVITINVKCLELPVCSDVSTKVRINSTTNPIDLLPSIQHSNNVSIGKPPLHGIVSLSGTTILYTPSHGFYGSDQMTYVLKNTMGSVTCKCNITVGSPLPKCQNSAAIVMENSSNNSIDLSQYIQYWSDDPALSIVTKPTNGKASVLDETLVYTPTVDYYGSDSINYIAKNNTGSSFQCKCSITVSPLKPTCGDVSIVTEENTTGSIDLTSHVSNMTISSLSSIKIYTNPQNGIGKMYGKVLNYTPNTDYYGSDSLQYYAINETGSSTPCKCNITVKISKPSCPNPRTTGTVDQNSSNNIIDLTDKIKNWTTKSSIKITTKAAHGVASFTDRVIKYTPTTNFAGYDGFNFVITNETGTSPQCNCSIKVLPHFYVTGYYVTIPNTTPFTRSVSIYDNVKNLKYTISVSTPSHGTVSLSGDNFTYTPTMPYVGTDTFTYTVTLSDGEVSSAKIYVKITATAPIAGNVYATPFIDTTWSYDLVTSIQRYVTGDVITLVSSPAKGQASISGTKVTVKMDATSMDTYTFIYKVTDKYKQTSSATITLKPQASKATPAPISGSPIAGDVSASPFIGTTWISDLVTDKAISNYSSSDIVQLASHPAQGQASISGTTVTVVMDATCMDTYTFTYSVTRNKQTSIGTIILRPQKH